MNTRPLFLLSAVLTGIIGAGCGPAVERRVAEDLPAAQVRVQSVDARPRVATEEVVGTVRARLRAVLEAKIGGRIEQMLAVPGQSVRAGDLLVQLDSGEIQARLDQALAIRDQYARETERLRRLLADQTVSLQEFEATESRHRVAEASVAEAQTLLRQTRIVAPFDGVVARKFADVGDLASPGRALLEMDQPAALRLEADVPQALIDQIQFGTSMRVRAGSLTNDLTGTVGEIAPAADENSRTFLVKLDLPPNSGLRPGQFGRVAVPVGESTALRAPASAVLQRGQMEIVFVVEEQKARLRLVRTGKQVGDEVELVAGVVAGEQVVTSDAAALTDGQPVEILP